MMITLIWIFLAVLEALKWLALITCIAAFCWLTQRPSLRDVAQGLLLGAVIGMIVTLPRPLITMDLSATMPTRLFYPELFLLVCCVGVAFVLAKKQLESKLRSHAYSSTSH